MTNVEQPSATFRPAVLLGGSPSPRAGHLPFASDLIAALEPALIVELGVSYGDTYFGFCQMAAERELACACYGIDKWHSSDESAAAENSIFDAVSRYNSKYRTFSHLLRKRYDQALAQFTDDSIDLLNMEGLQPYDISKQTFQAWLPKLKPGGVILLNDISLRGGEAGAWRLWEEVKASYPHFSFRNNNGLGVLAKSRKDADKIPFLTALFKAPRDQQERIRRYYFLCAERLDLAARLGASAGAPDTGCSLFQVFRSQAGNYETCPELSQVLSPRSWINLHLHLPSGVGDRPLRIDAANRPAVIDLAMLCLRRADGQAIWTWNPKDATDDLELAGPAVRMSSNEHFRLLSLGSTAHLYLPEFRGPIFDQPLDLEVRLRIDLELTPVLEFTGKSADPTALSKAKSEAAKQLAQARVETEIKIKQVTADAEARLAAMRSEFEGQLAQHSLELEEEKRAHKATVIDRDQLIAAQPRMLQEISIAQGNVEELKAEIETISSENASLAYDLTELRKLNARLAAALEEERSTRAIMQDSSSWQITKPFRAVGELFGPRKKY